MKRLLVFMAVVASSAAVMAQDASTPSAMTLPDTQSAATCQTQYAGPSAKDFGKLKASRSGWIRDNKSDTVVVFVHGIWSDSVAAWLTTSAPCSYWPDLLAEDPAFFKDVDVFVAGYYSQADSGNYSIADAAGELFTALSSPIDDHDLAPLHRKNILFLTHSLGGIVVRQALQANRAALEHRRIALALMGSPSRGSAYAKGLSDWFGDFYKSSLLTELSAGSAALTQVDAQFQSWLNERKGRVAVQVVEFFESTFPAKGKCNLLWWFCDWVAVNMPPIVEMSSAGNYGGAPRRIGDTDHITLVKPRKRDGGIHQEIRSFFAASFPNARTLYKSGLGAITTSGSIQDMAWQKFGSSSDWIFTARWPCDPAATNGGCGPWSREYGRGFNADNPRENDEGFVVLQDSVVDAKPPLAFRFSGGYFPPPGRANFNGKAIYSSVSVAAAHVGGADSDAYAMRQMIVQPVIYQPTRSLPQTLVTSIPARSGSGFVLEIPTRMLDAKLQITGIGGESSVSLSGITVGERHGILRVDAIDRRADVTRVSFSVAPPL